MPDLIVRYMKTSTITAESSVFIFNNARILIHNREAAHLVSVPLTQEVCQTMCDVSTSSNDSNEVLPINVRATRFILFNYIYGSSLFETANETIPLYLVATQLSVKACVLVNACVLHCDVYHAGSCNVGNTMSLRCRLRTS